MFQKTRVDQGCRQGIITCQGEFTDTLRPQYADVTRVAVPQMQFARMEELRSATVLARMLKDTEREGYAKELLGRVYRTFTLGPEFPDLKQAGRVLASLGETI